MSCSVVGFYELPSAAFDRFFSGFRFDVGGRYVGLAHDLAWGTLVSGSTILAEIARAIRTGRDPDADKIDRAHRLLRTPAEKYSTRRRKMSAPAPQDVVAPLPQVKSVSAVSCDRFRAAGGASTPGA